MAPDSGGSRSAVRAALLRALHAESDEPRVFDDYLAAKLVTAAERADFERVVLGALSPGVDVPASPPALLMREALQAVTTQELMLTRPRFIEDHLVDHVARGVSQYVVLGAGLDTFALRRPDLRDRLTVFEIDHPSTQEFKRSRLAAAGLGRPPNLHFVPADFERESLREILRRSPYRSDLPAFFSWAGVTYYLSQGAVRAVFGSIREAAARGSCVAFDYLDLDAFDPRRASARIRVVMDRVRRSGEPMITGLDPGRLPSLLDALGFRVVETLGPADRALRYFDRRIDGLRASEHFHLVLAEIRALPRSPD